MDFWRSHKILTKTGAMAEGNFYGRFLTIYGKIEFLAPDEPDLPDVPYYATWMEFS